MSLERARPTFLPGVPEGGDQENWPTQEEGAPHGAGRLGVQMNPAQTRSVLQAQQVAIWPRISCSFPDTQKEEIKCDFGLK